MKLNEIPQNQGGRGPLPIMESYEQAEAVARKEHDPCWSEADLATYRRKALALPPLSTVSPSEDGLPAGLAAALALCPPLHSEQPLWS